MPDTTYQELTEWLFSSDADIFKKLTETIPVLIYVYQKNQVIYVNPAFEKALGYTRDEMLDKTFWDICAPQFKEIVRQRGQARLRGEKIIDNYEIEVITKNGENLWADVFFATTRINGKTISIVGAYDITEKKYLQEQLRLSEERYRGVVEDQTELIARFDSNYRITFANEALCRFLNLPRENIIGQDFSFILTKRNLTEVNDILSSLDFDNPSITSEHQISIADKEPIWMEWIYRVITDSNGRIAEYQAVGRDISRRKRMEQELQQAHDKLERRVEERTSELSKANRELTILNQNLNNVIANMSDGVVILERSGRYEILNPDFVRRWGTELKHLQGQLITILQEEKSSHLNDMFNKRKPFKDEEIILPTSGSNIHFLASGTPIINKSGEVDSGVLIVRPIKDVRNLVNRFSGATARFKFEDIITSSTSMKELMVQAKNAALGTNNILIEGESGTGKEMVAQAIHNHSYRRKGPFVAVNCGAIPRELLGSELFGYAEGAFTGAKKGGNPGKFELASGGTLFLDEIGDMPMEQQVALLRVIQEKQITRIGGNQIIPVDVRIICATNKDLNNEVANGNFRQDLYYRLNVISLIVPPLRQRKEDIELLFKYFINKANPALFQDGINIPADILSSLKKYSWPGNVRELQNITERLLNTSDEDNIRWEIIPHHISPGRTEAKYTPLLNNNSKVSIEEARQSKKEARIEEEKQEILYLLDLYEGNVSQVAREMGIARTTLYKKMRKYHIKV